MDDEDEGRDLSVVTAHWTFEPGQVVWVPYHEEGYAKATYLKGDEQFVWVKLNGTEQKFKFVAVFPVNSDSQSGAPDNTRLMYLHDPHLLDNVRYRFEKNEIYTYTAHILIVVNPFKVFPELYSLENMQKYRSRPIGTMPPHVFAIADRAYRSMIVDGTSQGVIVSGESGAGKTETAKHVMSYLAIVGGMEGGLGKLERKILEANPILEAFGNAKTLRNNNSSRFGKFTKIDFDENGKIIGATIDTYLLEKSRLLFQAKGERNYHIFYQMLKGLSAEDKKALKLTIPEDYHYLRQGEACEIKGVDDKRDFERVITGLDLVGLDAKARFTIWRLLAGVLHLGNIYFEEVDEAAQIENIDDLERCAEMLQVDILKLRTGLLTRSITAGKSEEGFEVPLNPQQAQYSRDSLASLIYSRLFEFIVANINKSLALQNSKSSKDLFIGVLDIYGFEVFEKNSFEQLTINYANEKVHQYFIKNTFKEEGEIYKREAIKMPEIKFQDNQDALDMLEDKKRGVFAMIDDEGKKPKASDTNLLANLHTAHRSKTKRWIKPANAKVGVGQKKVTEKEAFVFRHFAGEVAYSIESFLDKNTQQISVDAEMVLRTSEHPLFKTLFPEFHTQQQAKKGKAPKTVSAHFLAQLDELMNVLESTTPSFIRCIKPNSAQVPGVFDGRMCLEQLRCSGMLEALSLMQIGYPTRCPYDYLYNMYVKQMPEAIRHLPASQFVEAILMALELDRNQYSLGVTRVFFKAGQLAFLEQLTGRDLSEGGLDIVAKVKKWLIRKRWRKACSVVKTCVKLMKMNVGMLHLKRLRRAARVMTLINKGILRRARAIKQRNAALTLQAAAKKYIAIAHMKKVRNASLIVQHQWRMLTLRIPHMKQVSEARIRKKIEEDLRAREGGSVAGKQENAASSDPYAIAQRRSNKKKKESTSSVVQPPPVPTPPPQAPVDTQTQEKLQSMLDQMRKMQEMVEAANKDEPVEGEESVGVPSKAGLIRKKAGSVMMIGEDLDQRLKLIQNYLELIPNIDENVISMFRSITGEEPKRTKKRLVPFENDDANPSLEQGEVSEERSSKDEVPVTEAQYISSEGVGSSTSVAILPARASEFMGQLDQLKSLMRQNLLETQAQTALLEEMTSQKDDDSIRNSKIVQKLQEEYREMKDMLFKARVEIDTKAIEVTRLDELRKEQKQQIVELESENRKLLEEREALSAKAAHDSAHYDGIEGRLAEKEKENEQLRDKVDSLTEQLELIKRSVKELIRSRSKQKSTLAPEPRRPSRPTSVRLSIAPRPSVQGLQPAAPQPRPTSSGRARSHTEQLEAALDAEIAVPRSRVDDGE
eukprot:c18673_g1_i1.p1 GENE.c18673_g1_i1~~c18673_g1_i1.p1  ORF type:complete len:1329 (+),score=307.37 c18673_g1_i1:31-4017(+)